MPFAWTLAKLLVKVVAPSVPDIVSTVAALKKQRLRDQDEAGRDGDAVEKRLAGLEETVAAQLHLIEQLTGRLHALHNTVAVTLRLAIAGLILSVVALAVAILR